MATVGSLMVDIGANVARLQTDLNKGLGEINKFQNNATSIFKSAAGAMAGYFTFSGVVSAIQSVTEAAAKQDKAIRELKVTLQSQGYQVQELLGVYQAWADQIRENTAYDDEAALAAMKFLTIMGIAPAKMKEATQAALDYATVTGTDLETAARDVGAAMNGQYRALGKLIPELKNLEGAAKNADNVLKIIEKRLGPQAQAEAESYGGQVNRLKNEFDELKKEIGQGLVPVLTGASMWLRDMLQGIREYYHGASLATMEAELTQINYIIAAKTAMGREYLKGAWTRARDENEPRFAWTIEKLQEEKDILEGQIRGTKTPKPTVNLPTSPPGGIVTKGGTSGIDQYASLIRDWQLQVDNAKADPFLAELAKIDNAIEDQRVKFGKKSGFEKMADSYKNSEYSKVITKYANQDFDLMLNLEKETDKLKEKREEAYASYAQWDYDFTENQRKNAETRTIITAEEWANKNALIQDAFNTQAKIYEEGWGAIASAVSGVDTPGATTILSGQKMLADIALQKDAYSQTLDAAWEHYEQMLTSKQDYLNRSYLLGEYYNNLMVMEDQRANMAKWQSYAAYAQIMKGGIDALASFTDSNNKAMFLASKAAGIAMILLQGHIAAMGAASAVASIPYVGPALAAQQYAQWMGITYMQAGLAAAIAIGQAAGMGKSSINTSSIGSAAVSSQQTIPTTTERVLGSQGIQIYIYGNVYDEKKLARELQPYLIQAYADGVR